jgi:uncharacterized protein
VNPTDTLQSDLAPVRPDSRILSLDVLRGFAILGILIMNIQSFSMISAAYINPTAYGDLTGINKWVWILSHILADSKFMTLFSALFGVGIVLMAEKSRSAGRNPAGLHYRRIFWLLVIGLLHGYFLWQGDILYGYALCGILVFLFRKSRPGMLVLFGFLSMLVPFLLYIMSGLTIEYWPEEDYSSTLENWLPAAGTIQEELATYRGGWLERFRLRAGETFFMETFYFLFRESWHSGGIMLFGMALYKWDFFSAKRSDRTYLVSTITGLVMGLLLIIPGIFQNFSKDWSFEYSMWFGVQFNYWGSLGVSLAWASLIMLICKKELFPGFRRILGLVGRTALSNYLFQTLVCVLIFYGAGLGLFGSVERWQQILIVPGIWALQMMLTWLWMKKFRYGPAEWLWRSLTYWKLQSINK